ncbi:hypothetical protein U1839_23695 [Sphingomonas sp. RT2P30]|uniref:hypothetical protein n=1 Tax=Parasphingomonas halimpatiens TaxID=3096162 RepID=UPI002FC97714
MLLRLILALLMVALAMPAMASHGCHDDMPAATAHAMAMSVPMPMGKHDGTAAEHVCAGCIPPSTWRSNIPASPVLTAPLPLASRIATLDLAPPAPPATPPPRRIG